jgi:hypothetical protein
MNLDYTRDIPDGPHNPSADQGPMKTNTNSIDTLLAVDHYSFNDNNGGYHDIIHFPRRSPSNDPATIALIGQEYTKTVIPTGGVADEQLFYKSALGIITQLTGPNAALASENGYMWLPGGILVQWGFKNGNHGADNHFEGGDTRTVTFSTLNIPFPNTCFGASVTPYYITTGGNTFNTSSFTLSVNYTSMSATSFQFHVVTDSQSIVKVFWIAIGN